MSVIRLFSFRAAQLGFDRVLRTELIPELLSKPGILDCYVGRQGPDGLGPRIVATVWESREAMVDGVSDRLGVFHPEYVDATTDQALDILELRVIWRRDHDPARILRVLRGEVRSGELAAYVLDVEHGVELDAINERGPTALYLGEAGPDRFVTVSNWREWSDIERATGGNIARPRATRHPERLIAWDVEHYEIVQY